MAKSNRKEKKIQFYQHKIYTHEAELMHVKAKYDSLPKGVLDLDKARSNHLYRLKIKMERIENVIKGYQKLLDEVKAM